MPSQEETAQVVPQPSPVKAKNGLSNTQLIQMNEEHFSRYHQDICVVDYTAVAATTAKSRATTKIVSAVLGPKHSVQQQFLALCEAENLFSDLLSNFKSVIQFATKKTNHKYGRQR